MPRLIVIGGHTRNIGKTQLVVEVLRAFPERKWLAAKITQFGHGVCSVNGERCGCADDEHTVAVDVETDRTGKTDTSRFLVAGADRVLWVRTKQGRLAEAMPQLREEMAAAEDIIFESNTVLGFLKPDLYLPVLDFSQPDFKDSARAMLDRADAYVIVEPIAMNRPEDVEFHTEPRGLRRGEVLSDVTPKQRPFGLAQDKLGGSGQGSEGLPIPDWKGVSLKWLAERPVFRVQPSELCPPPLVEFIRERVFPISPVLR